MSIPFIFLIFVIVMGFAIFTGICVKKPKLAATAIGVIFVSAGIIAYVFFDNGQRTHQSITLYPETNELINEAAVWSSGMENEFVADIYPSKASAVRSLVLRFRWHFQAILSNPESPDLVVLIQDSQNAELVEELQAAVLKNFPEIKCRIQTRDATIQNNEVKISLDITDKHPVNQSILIERPPANGISFVPQVYDLTYESGTIRANIIHDSWGANVNVDYIEKTWVENLAYFLNNTPKLQFIVAQSSESCLTQAEAERQAMQDAALKLGEYIMPQQKSVQISDRDLLNSGLIVDRFVQSFEGSAGKIWRQALLLNVSTDKVNQLYDNIGEVSRTQANRRTATIVSMLGMLLLITAVYFFLNAATKGYYIWSLRVVGVIFALILIIILLNMI